MDYTIRQLCTSWSHLHEFNRRSVTFAKPYRFCCPWLLHYSKKHRENCLLKFLSSASLYTLRLSILPYLHLYLSHLCFSYSYLQKILKRTKRWNSWPKLYKYLLPKEKAGALPRFESGTVFPGNSIRNFAHCTLSVYFNEYTMKTKKIVRTNQWW